MSGTQAGLPSASFDWASGRGEKWRDQLVAMEAMLAPVDEPLIDALKLDCAYRIADLGCGGGGTTRELLRRAPLGSSVDGFDISPPLIEAARANVRDGERNIAFSLADVSQAPPPSAPYDRLLSRFGIMFYADPAAAFANLARWLVPGGRFAFAVWGRALDNPWQSMVREIAAEVVELAQPDPAGPGPFRYGEPQILHSLLDRAGLTELRVRDWHGTLAIGGGLPAAAAAEFALRSSSIAEPVIAAGERVFESARQALAARFVRHEASGVVRLGASVLIVTGSRLEAP